MSDSDQQQFLSQLVQEAVEYGWEGDYFEVYNFVKATHEKYALTPPERLNAPL